MRNFTLCFLLSMLVSFAFLNAHAQKRSLNNVLQIELRNIGIIYNQNEVTGYYMFYKVDRIDRNTNSYLLRVFDQNLNQLSESKIEETKYLNLVEGAYNQKSLMFKFYDTKEQKLVFYNYDNKSQLKSRSERKLKSITEIFMYTTAFEKEINATALCAIPGQGFVNYGLKVEGKSEYSITFYPEGKDQKGWKYEVPDSSKEVRSASCASFIVANKDMLIINVYTKGKEIQAYVVAINVKTGEKMFEMNEMQDSVHSFYFKHGYIDETTGNIALLGEYYNLDDDHFSDKSLGLCSLLLSRDGKIITKNYASWLSDVNKFLPVDAKGKNEDVGYVYFHEIIKTADGKVFAIGEQYREEARGSTTRRISDSNGKTKTTIGNMVIMEFSSQFKLEDVKFFDKSKTIIPLHSISNSSPQSNAYFLKILGHFDYSFAQPTPDNAGFTIGYIDYEKNKNEKGKAVFGGISYRDKQYAIDKLPLKKEGSLLGIMPGKAGYVTIFEYFKKEKKLDMRLEKINF